MENIKILYTVTLTGTNGTFTGAGIYEEGSIINITATPNSGYIFSQWSDGNTNSTRSITVDSDISLSCSFSKTYTVTLTAGDNGSVSGSGTYTQGTQVTISATPNSGYKFSQWSDGNTNTTRSITVDSDISLSCSFIEKVYYTVTLTAGDNGSVSGGGSYEEGSVITITATPNTGYQFSQWSDGNTSSSRSITLNSDITLNATFDIRTQQNNEIWYTSSDGNVVTPTKTSSTYFGANIVSNTYTGGQGVITFDGNVTLIGEQAFEWCQTLTSISIPNTVTSIEGHAFEGYLTSLTSITLSNSLTSIGDCAFNGCSGLTSITIPDSVTSIEDYTFQDCSSLTSIIIPSSVTSIGYGAFNGCSGLTSITIPLSVTSITGNAFYRCLGLTSIIVDSANTTYDSRNNCNAIIETSTNKLISGCTYTTIPNSVTSIGLEAFSAGGDMIGEGDSSMTSITIPNSVTSIGDYAFQGRKGLTSITIPSSVTSIGGGAFSNCSGLTSITIPDSVTSIEDYTFQGCSSLTSIIIPDSVTSIGEYAFQDSGLTSITIPDSVISIGMGAFNYELSEIYLESEFPPTISLGLFDDCNNITIFVPFGSLENYQTATNWSNYYNYITEY